MAGRRVDVGLLLFTGEGLRPGHVDLGVSPVELGTPAEQVDCDIGVIDHLQSHTGTPCQDLRSWPSPCHRS